MIAVQMQSYLNYQNYKNCVFNYIAKIVFLYKTKVKNTLNMYGNPNEQVQWLKKRMGINMTFLITQHVKLTL